MKNIITAFIAISSITGSLTAYSACSVDLPIAELSDCIVVEGSGATYIRDRDHISTISKEVEVVDINKPSYAYNKVDIKMDK